MRQLILSALFGCLVSLPNLVLANVFSNHPQTSGMSPSIYALSADHTLMPEGAGYVGVVNDKIIFADKPFQITHSYNPTNLADLGVVVREDLSISKVSYYSFNNGLEVHI